jgi:tRNA(adenine34) deaminase
MNSVTKNRSDIDFMRLALEAARGAQAAGEVPVGAVLVQGEAVLSVAANRPIAVHDPTAHAEIEALRAGGKALGSYRLGGTTLYVTLEPCVMCASAIVHARVARVVFGAWDPKAGAAGSTTNVFTMPQMNHRVDVFGGVLMEECGQLLNSFFADRRNESI